MAIAIHTSPELMGRTAELFVQEAESKQDSRGPLTQEERLMLSVVKRNTLIMKEKLEKKYGIQL